MVTFSDNAAANLLHERLGLAAVTGAPARLGLDGTSLEETFVTTRRTSPGSSAISTRARR